MVTIDKIQEQIALAIEQSGLSQAALAQKIGISQQSISFYLHKQKMPALDTFAKLCVVLDLDANDILCIR